MKSSKGFIQTPLLISIVAGILILSGAGYFGVKQYKNYEIQKAAQVKIEEENKKANEEKEQKLQDLVNTQSTELERQKSEIEKIKNKPNVVINNPPQTQDNSSKLLSRADIIAQWTPEITHIACQVALTDPKNIETARSYGMDTRPYISLGSGLIFHLNNIFPGESQSTNIIAVITNLHVLTGHNGFSAASSCDVILPSGRKYSVGKSDIFSLKDPSNLQKQETIEYYDGQPYIIPIVDAGYLIIRNPDQKTRNLADKPKICPSPPRIGEDVIILGYPSTGASASVTATEGIVSGVEDNFFVTSAKVEHGNSGGAAIFKDQNCYFGIPTFVVSGELESLARILSFKSIFQ